jgi:hypothetical protein
MCLSFKTKGEGRDERGRGLWRTKDSCQKFVEATRLVRDDNQVRLGATEYPMACLYTGETVLSIAREGNESSYH